MSWKENYQAIKRYIADHAEIVINKGEISIPQEFRQEFYRIFDALRIATVADCCSSLSIDYSRLSENYLAIEKEVMELLALDEIAVPVDLSSFLHNPNEGLMRILYTRTFDLLQGKTTAEAFEAQAELDLRSVAAELFRLGYEQWAALVMIKLLEPDEAFLVDLDDDYKPFLRELRIIAFGRQAHHPTMRIPEFVLHSRKLNRYVAIKMVLAREIETYGAKLKPAVRPRKKTGDTSFALDSRTMLVSFMRSPEDIPIIADIYDLKLTSPDWMMEYISANELADPAALDQLRINLETMKPAQGCCLIVIGGEAEAIGDGIPENICAVSVGFDQSGLKIVMDQLASRA